MANLWTGMIDTNDEYVKLETASEQTFVDKTVYTIQIQNTAWIREGEDGEGFIITSNKPFTMTYDENEDIYIKTGFQSCIVNISDTQTFQF